MKKTIILSSFVLALLLLSCGDKSETQKQRFLIRGNAALAQQNYLEARRFYQEALLLDSCYSPALNNMGILRFEQKQYVQAIQAYDAALLCNPSDYEALLNRSNAQYEINQLYSAEADLEYLIRMHPDSSGIYFRIGLVHAKMHDYQKAIDDFSKALLKDPTHFEAQINRGSTYYYLGEYQKAEDDLRIAEQSEVSLGNVYNGQALLAIAQNNPSRAMERIERALSEEPLQPYFLNNRGYIYLLTGDLDRAREDIDRSITIDPENAWAYRNKGRWYHLKGQYDDALRLYALALNKDDFIENIYIFTGDTYAQMGQLSLACEAYEKADRNNAPLAGERLKKCNQ